MLGLAGLLVSTLLLPLGGEASSMAYYIASYALAILLIAMILYGFPDFVSGLSSPRLLAFGAASAIVGLLAVLPSRPDTLAGDAGTLELLMLFLANVFRLLAAASLGLTLARYVVSPGAALLIAGVAVASDLFSVFAGPTRALLREDPAILDFLLLIFPTVGQPLGFGLGLSDFIFLALFVYMCRPLNLRYRSTLASCCASILLVMTAGLFLGLPLPALPFMSLAFVLTNAGLLYSSFRK